MARLKGVSSVVASHIRRAVAAALLALTVVLGVVPASASGGKLFITSGREHADRTVTLPLYTGSRNGQPVYYILLDSSDGALADQYGINRSQKLANAAGSAAVQRVSIVNGTIQFPASVDFSPTRSVTPDPATGFPPLAASPGAVGEPGYSPLIQLPSGAILNAPQVGNASGWADKVVSYDLVTKTVRFAETQGFSGGNAVLYVSTDASDPGVAALENVTYAPALAAAPSFGDDSTKSAQTDLAAFINGQTGAANPNRQGLNSALLDGLDPLNILRWAPNQGRYSPLWDVHAAAWSAAAIAAGQNTRQMDYGTLLGLVEKGLVTGPGGAPFAPIGAIVNCPIVSQR
jgi:hypothetical protein